MIGDSKRLILKSKKENRKKSETRIKKREGEK